MTKQPAPPAAGSSANAASNNPYIHLLAGGVAGAVSRTATAPLERIKIFKQVQDVIKVGGIGIQHVVYKEGVLATLRSMLEREGFRGYFKGNGTNVVKVVPYSAIRFFSYEVYKKLFSTGDTLSTPVRLIAGGCAGATACVGTFPLDLIRTRLALQTVQQKYTGIISCARIIVKEEGVSGLYKGLGAAFLSAIPATAINFTTYEKLKEVTARFGASVIGFSWVNGAAAGAISMTILYPLDLCKRRMMMAGVAGYPVYRDPFACLAATVRNEGVRGMYKGIFLGYLKVLPAVALTFLTYESTLAFFNYF